MTAQSIKFLIGGRFAFDRRGGLKGQGNVHAEFPHRVKMPAQKHRQGEAQRQIQDRDEEYEKHFLMSWASLESIDREPPLNFRS